MRFFRYILKGSCGLKYDLHIKQNFQHPTSRKGFTNNNYLTVFNLVWFAAAAFIIYAVLSGFLRTGGRPLSNGRNFNSFSPPDSPPPTYDSQNNNFSRCDSSFFFSSSSPFRRFSRLGLGHNFWTGLGLGALSGYFLGGAQRNSFRSYRSRDFGSTTFNSLSGSFFV
jgi:hypothetical protein